MSTSPPKKENNTNSIDIYFEHKAWRGDPGEEREGKNPQHWLFHNTDYYMTLKLTFHASLSNPYTTG